MKNWNLFTNGKFKALAHTNYGKEIITIVGCEWLRNSPDCWIIKGVNLDTKIEVAFGSREVTLIARPIESLTDEEWDEIDKMNDGKSKHPHCTRWEYYQGLWTIASKTIQGGMSLNEAKYLLSIGVYPFDQKAFETGEVINANSLEEA